MPESALPEPNPLYTAEQAAAAFGMKYRTWRGLFDSRALPLIRIGRRLYVRRSDALAFLTANAVQPRAVGQPE